MQDIVLTVNTVTLKKGSQSIGSDLEALRGALDTLYGLTEKLNITWDGEAAGRFAARFSEDRAMFEKTFKYYLALNEKLEKAANAYSNAENTADTLVGGLGKI